MQTQTQTGTNPTPAPSFSIRNVLVPVIVLGLLVAGWAYYSTRQTPTQGPTAKLLGEFERKFAAKQTLGKDYQDADGDFVADPPASPVKVEKILFSGIPSETEERNQRDAAVWKSLVDHIARETGLPAEYKAFTETEAELEALRSGQLQVAAFNTGKVAEAVNTAGFVPLYVPSRDGSDPYAYQMQIIVPAGSAVKSLQDLRGKTLTLTSMSSLSGFRAPVVALAKNGLSPLDDYEISMSGSHENSIRAVVLGEKVTAAAVASDMIDRSFRSEAARIDKELEQLKNAPGDLTADQVRAKREQLEKLKPHLTRERLQVIHTSEGFPPLCFGISHTLPADLRGKIEKAFADYHFEDEAAKKEYQAAGYTRFAKVNYKEHWKGVRETDATLRGFESQKR